MAKQAKSALDMIREVHGSGSVFGGDESVHFSVDATSSGSFNLDSAIGCGGIPDGRLTLWSGPESSGKTLGSLCFAKKKQQEGKRILFIDAECTWDHNWASMLGLKVDADSMMVAQESSGSKIFDLLCGKPSNKKRKSPIPGILSEEFLSKMEEEGSPLGAIILDSINAVAPPLEEDMETGDQQIGSLSRFLPPMLRRLTPLLKRFNVPMIAICQARTNIGQMRGDPLTISGGKALMHAASLWLDSRKINGTEIYTDSDINQENPIGHCLRIKVRKNKVGPPARKAEMTIYYTRGIDLRPELIDQGLERGLISNEGKTFYYSGFEGGKIVGKNNVKAAIFNDKTLAKRLFNDIINHRDNVEREARRNSIDFVEEQDEDVIVGKVDKKFAQDEGEVKVQRADEVKGKIQVRSDGTRVNIETGEVLERELDFEREIVQEEDPFIDPEDSKIESCEDDGEDENIEEPQTVERSSSPTNLDEISLKELKDLGREYKIKSWYKLTSEELKDELRKVL